MRGMIKSLITELEDFRAETGLSEHRVGIVLARDGRIFDRLRAGGRVWPEKDAAIRLAIRNERRKREIKRASA